MHESADQPSTKVCSPQPVDKATPPPELLCPISGDLFRDPVRLASGQTYSRDSIVRWLASGNPSCPLTRQSVDPLDLQPDEEAAAAVQAWLQQHGQECESIDPSSDDEVGVPLILRCCVWGGGVWPKRALQRHPTRLSRLPGTAVGLPHPAGSWSSTALACKHSGRNTAADALS